MRQFLIRIVCFVIPGLLLLTIPLYRRLSGKGFKGFYMTDHIYTGRIYAAIPFGVAFLFFAAATIPTDIDTGLILGYIGGAFGILGLIFAFTQPSFLKPAWLKWLEREHGDIMPLLRKEAQKMGLNVWNERIQTQADLEKWVKEVRQKYGV